MAAVPSELAAPRRYQPYCVPDGRMHASAGLAPLLSKYFNFTSVYSFGLTSDASEFADAYSDEGGQ